MNRSAFLELANSYADLLNAAGAVAARAPLNQQLLSPENRSVILNHARWQIEMVRRVAHRLGGETTALRLLGSAQGILIATGLVTVREIWEANKKWLDGASVRAFDITMAELNRDEVLD